MPEPTIPVNQRTPFRFPPDRAHAVLPKLPKGSLVVCAGHPRPGAAPISRVYEALGGFAWSTASGGNILESDLIKLIHTIQGYAWIALPATEPCPATLVHGVIPEPAEGAGA